MMRRAIGLVLFSAALGSPAAVADSLFVGTLERKDVRIVNFRNGMVEFSIAGRAVDPVAADRISRLAIDDEPAFSKADLAFVEGRFAEAADGYRQAVAATSKPWLKDWIAPRLLQAAGKAGRFDQAVTAFVQLLQQDAAVAIANRPEVPASAPPAMLNNAAAELARVGNSPSLPAAQQQAALSLLLDVRRAQGDLASAGKVADQLLRTMPQDSKDPSSLRVMANVRLGVAHLALAQSDPARAISQIREKSDAFSDPAQQAEALFLLARAYDAQTGADASADATRDLAIAYMRAVAASRKAADTRFMPESLFRVAELHERLGDLPAARTLYAEVATEYKDNPLAAKAAEHQVRLNNQTGS